MRCNRQPEHLNPAGARFCVTCGVPLQQRCPYDPNHWIEVVGANGVSPRNCVQCGRLLRACPHCRRLHRLADTQCATRACGAAALPPVGSDWPTWGGSQHRSGSTTLDRDCLLASESVKAWDLPLTTRVTAAISAYGSLYVASESAVSVVEFGKPQPQWRSVHLRSALRAAPGSLLAAGGMVLALSERQACALSPDTLNELSVLDGDFQWQAYLDDRWLLYGVPEGEVGPRFLSLSFQDLNTPPRATRPGDGQKLLGPPVVCGDSLYCHGPAGEVYRYQEGAFAHLCNAAGPIVAMAAAPSNADLAGLYLLTREAGCEQHLQLLDPDRPAFPATVPVVGTRIAPRLWTAGPYVVVARNGVPGNSQESAAFLRFDQRQFGAQPQSLTWPTALQLEDALLLAGPDHLTLEMALHDSGLNLTSFVRTTWEEQSAVQLSRAIGLKSLSYIVHQPFTVAIGEQQLDLQRQFLLKGFRLWAD